MGSIRVLPRHMRDLIAAGEVCERPSSVAKELIENALDAGAENITVWLERGGLGLLRVADDGIGMSPDDAALCFSRHATSKLPTDDLVGIVTMGFRGEALAAISAVSRIQLITKPRGSIEGTELIMEGGETVSQQPVGCPEGTNISVSDLFYNTPARLKFMKRDSAEASMVEGVVERAAFSHPEVSFRLYKDGKEVMHTPGDGNLLSAIYCIYGSEYATKLMPLKYDYNGVSVRGYTAKPTAGRGNRAMQFFSINTRPIKSRMLAACLDEAYKNAMPFGKYAFCFLDITIPYELVDVNVHPAKTEVKFVREKDVFDCVYFGIKSLIRGSAEVDWTQSASSEKEAVPSGQPASEITPPQAPEITPIESAPVSLTPAVPKEIKANAVFFPAPAPKDPVSEEEEPLPMVSAPSFSYQVEKKNDAPIEEPQDPLPSPTPSQETEEIPVQETFVKAPSYRYKCEVFHTYIIAEGENDLFVIDKHAAHERMLYEELLTHEGEPDSQLLLTPLVVKLARDEYSTLIAAFDELEKAGFEVEDFGSGSLLVRRIPLCLLGHDVSASLSEISTALSEGKHDKRLSVRERLLYSVACRAAVKGGEYTTEAELNALCERVLDFQDIRFCPHGRPCVFRIGKNEIEKRFGRLG